MIAELIKTISELSARVRHLEAAEVAFSLPLHAKTHQDGGTDEIDVSGLSGKLADAQNAGWLCTKAISTAAPDEDDVLVWSGSEWAPTALTPDTIKVGAAGASSDLHLTNNYQDIPGCTKTITFASGDYLIVWGIFDFEMEYTSNTNDLIGALNFDGTALGTRAYFEGDAGGERGTVAQVWLVNPGTGEKTFKLQARRTTVGTGSYANATHTRMVWMRGKFTDES